MPRDACNREGGDGVAAVPLETDQERFLAFIRHNVDYEVGPLRGRERERKLTQRQRRLKGHSVERHDPALQATCLQRKDASIRRVHETQPHAGMLRYFTRPAAIAIHGDPVANPACMGPVMHIAEASRNLGLVGQTPIVEQQDFVEIDLRCAGCFLDY